MCYSIGNVTKFFLFSFFSFHVFLRIFFLFSCFIRIFIRIFSFSNTLEVKNRDNEKYYRGFFFVLQQNYSVLRCYEVLKVAICFATTKKNEWIRPNFKAFCLCCGVKLPYKTVFSLWRIAQSFDGLFVGLHN